MILGLIGFLITMVSIVWGIFIRDFLIGAVVGLALMAFTLEFWHD